MLQQIGMVSIVYNAERNKFADWTDFFRNETINVSLSQTENLT